MPVGAVNNNNQQQTYAVPGLLAGLGTGAIAGGTYGYLSKPWLKDGNITDKFVKQFDENNTKNSKNLNAQVVADLKKMKETGKIDGISDVTKFLLEESEYELKNLTPEQIKAIPNVFLGETDNFDELLTLRNRDIDNTSLKTVTENAEKWKAINVADNISIADLKKLYADNKELFNDKVNFTFFIVSNKEGKAISIEEALESGTEAYRKMIVKKIQQVREAKIAKATKDFADTKATILEHIDLSKKSMKELSSNADFETKEIFKVIKKTMKNMNLKAGAKWGAIGAGALGAIGLGIGAMNNKKS